MGTIRFVSLLMLYRILFPVVVHITGWLLFFSLILSFISASPGGANVFPLLLSPPYLLFYAVYLFLFYFNGYFLIPKLYLRKKYFSYLVIIGLLFTAVFFVKPFDRLMTRHPAALHNPPKPPPFYRPEGPPPRPSRRGQRYDIVSIILFLMVGSLSAAMQIIKQWRTSEQRAVQAEADKAHAELAFLKAQINPHFLFNTLNNIYVLAVAQHEKTAAAVLQLSHIMRYVTDEARQDFVPLQSEVDCIANYIDLQRLRLSARATVAFTVKGETAGKKIAPLILMPFVENVFKYGISSHEASPVTILLNVEPATITFYCRNKMFRSTSGAEGTGIGIKNTRERLQFLYPEQHTLSISTEGGYYSVTLAIQG